MTVYSEVADMYPVHEMKLHDWSEIPREQMNPMVARQAVHSETMTVARIYLAKGAIVPEHSHSNEQMSAVVEGKLRFRYPGGETVVTAGGMLEIPSGVPHQVEALEDSLALDIFSPPRVDWITGDDAYLR